MNGRKLLNQTNTTNRNQNMNKPHKHAALMRQYAQDAAETDKPWERWQYRLNDVHWTTFIQSDQFEDVEGIEYRRKPRVILINGIEVPEPMRERPEEGTYYWHPLIASASASCRNMWSNDDWHIVRFENGMCHSTREAAELHAKALLSFTKNEETK